MASNLTNSDSEVDLPVSRSSTSREFVWSEERTKSIPRGRAWDKLNRDGRVKELRFFPNWSGRRMRELIQSSFPALRGEDLSRLVSF